MSPTRQQCQKVEQSTGYKKQKILTKNLLCQARVKIQHGGYASKRKKCNRKNATTSHTKLFEFHNSLLTTFLCISLSAKTGCSIKCRVLLVPGDLLALAAVCREPGWWL